ncbi:hypothetical protein C8R47DRAFT_1319567 [Mycena vitilis]|nr:hypothetical protein C8R47DRAFT_1319567 [Mycena vitilis]
MAVEVQNNGGIGLKIKQAQRSLAVNNHNKYMAGASTNSLVKTLLAGNKRPTEAQEIEIRETIPSLRENVLKIETEFNDVDIALAIIPPEQTPDAGLTERLAQLTVPVELLELIFRLCLPQSHYIVPNPLQAPLLLCQICSSWRKVAILNPHLWCSLSLNLYRRPGAWKEFMSSWLGRSGDTPLSLSFEGAVNNPYFNDHIAKVVLKDSKRWRRLRLDVPSSSLSKLLNTDMPLLETLEIAAYKTYPGVFISSADAPRLRSLVLVGAQTEPKNIHVPWDRLTRFHAAMVALDLDKCLPVLAKCRNLTQCTIQLSLVDTIQVSQAQNLLPVRMPRLRNLFVIGRIDQSAVTTFFANVELPSLDRLELVNVPAGPFNLRPASSIVALARESNLRSLYLTGGRPKYLFETVVAIPSLRAVVLGDEDKLKWAIPREVQDALDMRK